MSKPSILCGIDFTRASDVALQAAVEETKRRDGILDLIHVWYPIDPIPVDMSGVGLPIYDAELPAELRNQLEQVRVDLPAERVRRHLEFGPAADQIVKKAEELQSELLVVGTHSRGPIMRWFVGSVATDLLRTAPCPILICRVPHAPSSETAANAESS
jgi:nucleotide-binding universal stress UspA family protein